VTQPPGIQEESLEVAFPHKVKDSTYSTKFTNSYTIERKGEREKERERARAIILVLHRSVSKAVIDICSLEFATQTKSAHF
jgi:hypothetical protein